MTILARIHDHEFQFMTIQKKTSIMNCTSYKPGYTGVICVIVIVLADCHTSYKPGYTRVNTLKQLSYSLSAYIFTFWISCAGHPSRYCAGHPSRYWVGHPSSKELDHENLVTISCFCTFLIFIQSYIFNFCIYYKCFFLYLYIYKSRG